MSGPERQMTRGEGYVHCTTAEISPENIIEDDGCVDTSPVILKCIRLANGNIGLVTPTPNELMFLMPDDETVQPKEAPDTPPQE